MAGFGMQVPRRLLQNSACAYVRLRLNCPQHYILLNHSFSCHSVCSAACAWSTLVERARALEGVTTVYGMIFQRLVQNSRLIDSRGDSSAHTASKTTLLPTRQVTAIISPATLYSALRAPDFLFVERACVLEGVTTVYVMIFQQLAASRAEFTTCRVSRRLCSNTAPASVDQDQIIYRLHQDVFTLRERTLLQLAKCWLARIQLLEWKVQERWGECWEKRW